MLTADHSNALWLTQLYAGSAAIATDPALDEATRAERMAEHHVSTMERISPDVVIHTGGVRLAVTGDLAFFQAYGRRRSALSTSTPVAVHLVLADDDYGIIHMRTRTTRGDEVWEREGMGAWRFEDGLAVEHWELGNGPAWDRFYLAADPTLRDGDAHEYWTREPDAP